MNITIDPAPAPSPPAAPKSPETAAVPNYLTEPYGWRSWLFTTDHKRIALLYMVTVTLFLFVGGAAATLIRLNLITPRGALVTAELYNKLFTAHGIVMVWFFLIPVIPTVLGNFVLPMMIGAKDLAFPNLNLLSWYVFTTGAVVTLTAILAGGVDTGWTFYPLFSTRSSYTYVMPAAVGIIIAGFSTIMTGLNFVITVHTLRAPGMTWGRLPIFVWTLYATSLIMLLATPVLAAVLALLVVERAAGIGIFDPALGGDPVLFQHLFWFYSHPAVYIMILPGMGGRHRTGHLLQSEERLRVQVHGRSQHVHRGLRVPGVGPSHVRGWPEPVRLDGIFGPQLPGRRAERGQGIQLDGDDVPRLDFVRGPDALRSGVHRPVHFRWDDRTVPCGAGGGSTRPRHVLHRRPFPLHHGRGMVSAYFGGLHYWWPKITGRLYSRIWSRLAALLIFAGFVLTFLPQFILGYMGMPRRYHHYPPEFQVLNVLSSAGASILAAGYLLPFTYLSYSLRWGSPAGPNPWRATGLEWQTPSPPPKHNFEETPVVTRGPYEYATEGDGHAR